MRFSVVEFGYDRRQVDSCLDELAVRLSRLAARAEAAAGTGREWDRIRQDATRLCDLVERRRAEAAGAGPGRSSPPDAEREAAELLARARVELDAAREEVRQLREQAYAEAVRARRDVEAALVARRRRATRVDEILTGPVGEPVAADTPTAAASVPSGGGPTTWAVAGAEPPGGRDIRVV